MIRNPILLKAFCVFFILEMISAAVIPTLSWALTAGPTAPEATSFEPVDTTDIVDLKTGDFVYNIPLLEVPGPAGGYPLSLSYHAGILPDQESSWTGLGFSCATGSITRLVNGYPDDHNAVNASNRSYWEGGDATTGTIGLSVGIANVASVSAGLTFSQDTYKGSGVGGYVGFGIGYQLSDNLSVGLHTTFGISAYGDMYSSMGAGVGVSAGSQEAMNATANVGISMNSEAELNAGASAGVGVGKTSLMGVSIGTGNSGASFSVGGATAGVYNNKTNHVSTYSSSFHIDIPIYYFSIRLGQDYQRYWIDEETSVNTYGSLYFGNVVPTSRTAFDTYDLLDITRDISLFDDEEKVLGGSFPDVDSYLVTAQGVSGSIKPYYFQKHLFRQDKKIENGDIVIKNYPLTPIIDNKPVEFRFINDFSNRFEAEKGHIDTKLDEKPGQEKFDLSIYYHADEYQSPWENGRDGYNKDNNHLAGSKHVEWYTNQDILKVNPNVNPFTDGFINCVADGFQRESNTQIGGYSITNESGVTYHFALPVYSYDEFTKSLNSQTKRIKNGERYNLLTKPAKYAYTWFLTAVTGPDFVDRNKNGLADHDDWGYWVNFEYKKWLSDYKWRNPGEGTNKDLDGDFENFSAGKKEIYYLDRITTQTHVAVFEKSQRFDGREVSRLEAGGFDPVPYVSKPGRQQCELNCCAPGEDNCSPSMCGCADLPDDEIAYHIPRPSLKLDKIKLFNYGDFIAAHTSDNYVLREIVFGYDDYSLAAGTPNSFDEEKPGERKGKLTLKTLSFLGKKEVSLIPSLTFAYTKNIPYSKDNGEVKVDLWGYYKSDFETNFRDETNDIIGRLTTPESAVDVDTWSLNEIKTASGVTITVNYESDEYNDVILAKRQSLRINEVTDYGSDKLKITFWEKATLSKYFEEGKEVDIDLIGSYYSKYNSRFVCSGDCDQITPYNYLPFLFSGSVMVENVSDDEKFIIVSNHNYYTNLKYESKKYSNGLEYDGYERDGTRKTFRWFYDFYFEEDQAWPDFFAAGIISLTETARKGGGLRVKSIGLNNSLGNGRLTEYFYENGKTTFEPYQILSPKILPEYKELADPIKTGILYKKAILNKVCKQINIARQLPGPGVLYQYVTVKEKNITPDGLTHDLPNYTKYEFEMYKADMVNIVYSSPYAAHWPFATGHYDGMEFSNGTINEVRLKDHSSCVGNLKSVTLFNSEDNLPISATINNYLSDNDDPLDKTFDERIIDDSNGFDLSPEKPPSKFEVDLATKYFNQGLIEEIFTRSRLVVNKSFDRNPYSSDDKPYFTENQITYRCSLIKSYTYPSIQIGQTNINYKTSVRNESENLAFDFYSGQVTQVLTTDSYGNNYLSVSVPAYQNYPAMGLKINDRTNRHMLTQSSGQYSYSVNSTNAPTGVLSASVQTWSDKILVLNQGTQANIWRPRSSYQWNGQQGLNSDGSYPFDNGLDPSQNFNIHPFTNWNNTSENEFWQKTGELTLYDVYSHGLEAKDINENYASTRMNNDQTKVIASAANAKYTEMAFAGAEYYSGNTEREGGVSRGEGNPSPAHVHTGQYSLLVGSAKNGFNYTLNPGLEKDQVKKYRASVWVYLPGEAETQSDLNKLELYYKVNETEKSISPIVQKNKSKSWYLLNIDIPLIGSSPVYIGVRNNTQRGAYFDDFRIHPLDASLTAFVYDPFSGELNYILDANNFYTKFEYDAMGRLVRTSKELLNFDFGDGKESYKADAILKETKYNYGKDN